MGDARSGGWLGGRFVAALLCALLAPATVALAQGGGIRPEDPPRFVERPGSMEFSGRMTVSVLSVEQRIARGELRAEAERGHRETIERLAEHLVEAHAIDGMYILEVPEGETENAFAARLLDAGGLAYAHPDWIVFPGEVPDRVVPNDPRYEWQWQHERIRMPEAWTIATGDPRVIAAVCDTGVDLGHPDLLPALVPGGVSAGPGPFQRQADGASVQDIQGHGTTVAGHIGAVGNNGFGVSGVGWNVSIMPIRVTDRPDGSAFQSDILQGAIWAAANGARVVNCSYSGVESAAVQNAGKEVRALGGLLFYSAGNDGRYLDHFDHPDVVVVGATIEDIDEFAGEQRAVFSAYGPAVDLFAPGASVFGLQWISGFGYASGTSFSSPIAAGVAALMWSADIQLTSFEVERLLYASCDDLGEPGDDREWGHGRVNAYEAMKRARVPEHVPGYFLLGDPPNGALGVSVYQRLTWTEAPEAEFYTVIVDDHAGFNSPLLQAQTVSQNWIDLAAFELEYDTVYFWRVLAENRRGPRYCIPFFAGFWTMPVPDPGPFGLLGPEDNELGAALSPTLSWTESRDAREYRLEISESRGFEETVFAMAVPRSQTRLSIPEGVLDYSRRYHWRILAVNEKSERIADGAPRSFRTRSAPPPTSFALTMPTNGQDEVPLPVRLEWDEGVAIDRFVVELDLTAKFPDPVVIERDGAENWAVVPVDALLPGSTYFWRVTAFNESGEHTSVFRKFATSSFVPERCDADVNGDVVTDLLDLAVIAANFGMASGATLEDGDVSGDGRVDLVDLSMLARDFGCGG